MIDREKLGKFDLSRLTWVGWLVSLLSIAGGMAIGISVGFYCRSEFPGPDGKPQKMDYHFGGCPWLWLYCCPV